MQHRPKYASAATHFFTDLAEGSTADDSGGMGDQLRAETFDDFIGQEEMKRRLLLRIRAAKANGRMLDDVFISAKPGSGKSSLARIIANEMEQPFLVCPWPTDSGGLKRVLYGFSGVVLIDEIHRGTASQKEELLSVLEFRELRMRSGATIELEPLTFVGCTTDRGKVLEPLRDRFKIKPELADYSEPELSQIILSMADKAGITLDPSVAAALAPATGGVPRIATRFVLAARDLIAIDEEVTAAAVLDLCEVDGDGLEPDHNAVLKALARFGSPVGLKTLSTVLRLPPSSVEDLERRLFDAGYITFTDQGRELTAAGYRRTKSQARGLPTLERKAAV